jgi:hypothetical protein
LITIPPNDRDGNYADVQGKVDALLQALMPEYDLVVMVVNDPQYGGSGGSTLLSSLNASSAEIVRHESGHTFAGLADEYSSAYPGYVPVEKPNATTQTSRALIRWTLWIDAGTPLPTPQTSTYAQVVGLFEGAEYQTTGWYRPKLDCKMNHLGVDFCQVCSEQIVKSAYQRLPLIQSSTPSSTSLTITSPQVVSFGLTTLQPATHNLVYQWFTNGTAVAGASNATFDLLPQSLGNGSHSLSGAAWDATSLVRNDPGSLLSNSVTWSLNIGLRQLSLTSVRAAAGSAFAFTVTGSAPNGFVLQTSSNLSSWVSFSTNALTAGRYDYTNHDPATFSRRFYRASIVP